MYNYYLCFEYGNAFVNYKYLLYNSFMAIKICTLASGSKGNSVLVDNGKNKLLIDAGLSMLETKKRLKKIDVDICDIDGILVTHEHIDHIKGIEKLSKLMPIYAHDYTMEIIAERCNIERKYQMSFSTDEFSIGSFDIKTFRTSHDVVYSLGYCISDCESKITYATDLGYCSKDFIKKASNSDLVFIESNHDLDMLLNGNYPAYLKRRIVSNRGHLSNDSCARAIWEICKTGTRKFILGHLSEQNNLPELAYWTNANYLISEGADMGKDIKLFVASQNEVSCIIECD